MWSGKHSQIPLWFIGVHSAFNAQSQGSTHFSLRQANAEAQSGSLRHSYCLHLSYGFPLWPGKQVHFGLWFRTEHSALTPHCSNKQGFWHSLLMQACVKGHSESLLQPARKNGEWFLYNLYLPNKNNYYPNKTLYVCVSSLRSSQIVNGSPTKPSRQTQRARWFLTIHSALIPQVCDWHGSWHFSRMHARCVGHS